MKKKNYLLTFCALLWSVCPTFGQFVAPAAGIYRMVNASYGKAVSENYVSGTVVCAASGDADDYEQMWILKESGTGFTIQNVFTGRFIQNKMYNYSTFEMGTGANVFYITQNASITSGSYYNITNSPSAGSGFHCDASSNVVLWGIGSGSVSATEWRFQKLDISEAQIAEARAAYTDYMNLKANASAYNTKLTLFFTDLSCETLLPAYTAMDDAALRTAMAELPEAIVEMAVKIKNKAWTEWEKEFRIADYKPYSNPEYWAGVVNTNIYGRLNNPTGIYGNKGDVIFIFVGDDIPQNATLQVEAVVGSSVWGTATTLQKGLNVIVTALDNSMLFIQYVVDTSGSKLIADFPHLNIHIGCGGIVNGYYDVDKHTDADWVSMQKLMTNPTVQVKGHYEMWHMNSQLVRQYCPDNIRSSITLWDSIVSWQHAIMNISDIYPSKYNNLENAVSTTSGYMSASNYATNYNENTLSNILNSQTVYASGGAIWGPAHEIGHTNQEVINLAGCTEVSNNLFSNIAVFRLGKCTSRGKGVAYVANNFEQGIHWGSYDIWSKTRLYYQLWLYYHVQGHNPNFYPTLFRLLREDPVTRSGNRITYGYEDWLKFAEKCCQAAGEDLSELFEAYGFFVPVSNYFVDDYTQYHVTATPQQIAESKARMQAYQRKAGNIMFIEDRIRRYQRIDPEAQPGDMRADFSDEAPVGAMGDIGQFEDFVDTLKCSGYIYTKSGLTLTVSGGTGAVGFKVYDANGTLVCLSNKYKFTLPQSMTGKSFVLKAAQVDGNDMIIPSQAEAGTEEEQLEALRASMATAKGYLDMTDAESAVVGYFKPQYMQTLRTLYDYSATAIEKADQSVHTYGAWSMLLEDEINQLLASKEALIPLYAENYYGLTNMNLSNYTLNYTSSGLNCSLTDPQSTSRKQWLFVPTGEENQYYIQNRENQYYISVAKSGVRVKAVATEVSDAVKFNLLEAYNGRYLLQVADADLYLQAGSDKTISVGTSSTNTAAMWRLTVAEDLHTELIRTQLESLLMRAKTTMDELVQTTTPNLVLFEDLTWLNDSLLTFTENFLSAYTEALHYAENLYRIEELYAALQERLAVVQGAYQKKLSLPAVSDNKTAVCYFIQNLSSGSYCYYDDGTGRYAGHIRTGVLADSNDRRFWFYFRPGAAADTYTVYNWETGQAVGINGNYLDLTGESEAEAFTFTFPEETYGTVIAGAQGYWNVQSLSTGYAVYRATPSYWKFSKIGSFDITGVVEMETEPEEDNDASWYDMQGRRVENPVKGLYINKGVKRVIQ